MCCPIGCASGDALHNKRDRGVAVPSGAMSQAALSSRRPLTISRWNLSRRPRVRSTSSVRRAHFATRCHRSRLARGEPSCVSFPVSVSFPSEPAGTPLPDSKAELPPVIRRTEVVAFALVALLIIVRRRGALCRQGVLPPDHDGVHRRHHAVAGGWPARALPNSPRRGRGADRDRGGRRRRLHGRPDRLAGDGMEHAACRNSARC